MLVERHLSIETQSALLKKENLIQVQRVFFSFFLLVKKCIELKVRQVDNRP